ncbi:MAG: response regulator [Magnetococcales bacterium]|nr:response regulator [Magnetococcales bacterium]
MTSKNKKPIILVVDDMPVNIKVLVTVLNPDYTVVVAASGQEALQVVADEPPDMILLDIMMPEMDGFKVCEKLKSMASTRDIPVLFITAKTETEDETHGLALGAVDFITKPINKSVVLARVKTHLALRKAQTQALQAAQAKSQFLAHMSHEIRTPLNGILGFADLLGKRSLDAKARQFLEIIQQSGQHLLAVVNDILDYSKIEANKVSLENVAFDLKELLAKTLDLLSLSAQDKGINLALRCAEEVPAVICGDPSRLRQVLFNLVANAIKFTQQGQVDLDVRWVQTLEESVTLQFSVRDTGIGISPDRLATLFQPFVQADISTTRQFGGTGLGLSICTNLVRLMGGEIQVDSEPGKGSCFHFTATFTLSTLTAGQAIHAPDPQQPSTPFHDHCHLLVVDDVAINRMFLSETLPLLGIDSFELACNGQEALERLQEQSFDLVLMDCRMPVMDGFMATRTLRHWEESTGKPRRTPVVALTAGATEDDRAHCLAAGMDDFLTKPVNDQALLKVLHRWLVTTPTIDTPKTEPGQKEEQAMASVTITDGSMDEAALDGKIRKIGKERMGRLVHAFFQDMTRNMDTLRISVKAQDATKILEAAHALKGCCGVVHATRMLRQCGEMQSMGRIGAIQGTTGLLEQLETECISVQKILEEKLT